MRWLMIGLLVSLGALLFAAAGVARHIWVQRAQLGRVPAAAIPAMQGEILDPAEESDVEIEI
jgi:hypothetical protein